MSAVIECRSSQEIDDDYMLETLAVLEADLAKWDFYSWQPPKRHLRGEQRAYALKLKAEIEDAILSGVTIEQFRVARRMIYLLNMPHAYL